MSGWNKVMIILFGVILGIDLIIPDPLPIVDEAILIAIESGLGIHGVRSIIENKNQ